MKVCFFLQRRFAYIGHVVACNLKTKFKTIDFCALVHMRSSYRFLLEQKDIHYSSLILDEDIHKEIKKTKLDYDYLIWLENEYGIPNLWPYLYIDRILMNGQLIREYPHNKPILSEKEMLVAIQITAKKIIEFVEKEKPDAVVMSVVGSLSSLFLYHIAKKKGAKTINIDVTRIKNRVGFSLDYKIFSWLKGIIKEFKQDNKNKVFLKEAQEFLNEFRQRPSTYLSKNLPSYNNQTKKISHLTFLIPKNLMRSIRWYTKEIWERIIKTNWDYIDVKIEWLLWDKFIRKVRGLIGYDDFYSPIDPNEKFVFFPLQYEPEISMMLYAPLYTDQIHLIKQIARSIPVDHKLYVKEHPAMVGYRRRKYYKEILKIPNIRLLDPIHNSCDIVRLAKLIITITGTVGWEAILFKKPVITFGDIFYNELSMVKRCRSYEDLAYLVKDQLTSFTCNEEELIYFLGALIKDSVPVNFLDLWQGENSFENIKNDDGIKALSNLLAEKLKI